MINLASLAKGDVVLVRFPFTDLSAGKLRPALVVGQVVGEDVTLAFITSQVPPSLGPAECLLQPADSEFRQTGLKVASVVRLDKLVTLHRGLVRRRLGHTGPRTGEDVARALRHFFGL